MNNNIAFLLSTIAGFSTLIGYLVLFLSKKKSLNFLIGGISFASSVMLFLSLFDLLPESISFFKTTYKALFSIILSLTFLSFGMCLSLIIDKLFPNTFNEKALYKLGIITTIGIIIHNIPEGISIALPIYYYTRSYKKAFLYVFICALSEPFGALLAFLFLKPTNMTLGIIYAIIAGIMIHISVYELLPEAQKYKRYRITYIFYILGIILVLANLLLF